MNEKQCTKCLKVKSIDSFNRNNGRDKNAIRHQCKDCEKVHREARRTGPPKPKGRPSSIVQSPRDWRIYRRGYKAALRKFEKIEAEVSELRIKLALAGVN